MRLSAWPFLLVLALIPLLHRWWVSRNRPARIRFPLPVAKTASERNPTQFLLVVRYLGLALIVFALARPQTSYRQTERTVSGIDIMMVLDVSMSMEIEDMGERSRMDVAKETVGAFLRGRENDRIGFIIFSGEPLTLAPPTLDYGIIEKAVRDARTGILKDGTAIGDGLSMAVNRMRNSKAKSRVIVLLTDGDNNVGQVDPATAGDLAAGYGLKVYTIAFGTEGRVRLPIRSKGVLGNTITTYQWMDNALNPELLKHIAKQTGGRFYRVQDAGTLDAVFKEINQLEKSEVKSHEKVKYDEAFQWPLKLGLLMLVIGQLLARGWWRLVP